MAAVGSIIRFFLVAGVAGLVWTLALGSIARWIWRAVRRGDAKAVPAWRKAAETTCVVLGALGILAIAWAALVEPYWPRVERSTIHSEKVQGRGFRIVHLSDLHSDPRERLEDDIPGIVAGLDPDLVVFTGDGINSEQGLPSFRSCMKALAAEYPTYGVRGNWEAWYFPGLDVFEGTGVHALSGTGDLVTLQGDEVWIAGAAVGQESGIAASMRDAPPGAFAVYLHHFPALAEHAVEQGADLVLSGDTHGGQVRVPPLGALIRVHRHGFWAPAGMHEVGDAHLYISQGIGMEGGRAPRVRFMCRPEIAVIDVQPGGP